MATTSTTSQASVLRGLDNGHLTARYWALFTLIGICGILEFFDLFIVGFIVAVVGPQWELTYAASAIMLLSGGLGTIAGALVSGAAADKWGRRATFIITAALCGAGSLLLATVDERAWVVFSLLRFVIGFGVGGAATVQAPLIIELTPLRFRSFLPGLLVAIASFGFLIASISAATIMDSVGWRGLAIIGGIPLAIALVAGFIVPESPRWLITKGRTSEAQEIARRVAGVSLFEAGEPAEGANTEQGSPLSSIETVSAPRTRRTKLLLIFMSWFGVSAALNGVYLWGPTMLGVAAEITVKQAATYFVFVSLGGLFGKFLFAVAPQFFGRRRVAVLTAAGGAVALAASAFAGGSFLVGVPLLFLALVFCTFFLEGGYSNITPYTAELFAVDDAGRAMGIAQAANGLGKVFGPLSLALVAGMGEKLTPKGTIEALMPGFMLLSACAVLTAVGFIALRTETHRKSIPLFEAK